MEVSINPIRPPVDLVAVNMVWVILITIEVFHQVTVVPMDRLVKPIQQLVKAVKRDKVQPLGPGEPLQVRYTLAEVAVDFMAQIVDFQWDVEVQAAEVKVIRLGAEAPMEPPIRAAEVVDRTTEEGQRLVI